MKKERIDEDRKKKMILFFGFYFFFFLFLIIYLKSSSNKKVNDIKDNSTNSAVTEKENNTIDNYSLNNILNSDFNLKIIIEENDEKRSYVAEKSNLPEDKYNYFFNIYNVNQLIKKGKLISRDDYTFVFEIDNSYINEILNNDISGNSIINLITDNKGNVYEIQFKLYDNTLIKLNYEVK